MKYRLLCCVLALFAVLSSEAQKVNQYNITWNSQSKNASESMPCGGGDIGMNVWVENGELFIYVAKSGSFDENNALMKSGRLRLKFFPNPFNESLFKQELHLQEGYVSVEGENNGVKTSVKIWADVFHPVAHIDITSSKNIATEVAYESWRYQDRVIQQRENFGNSYKWAAPKNNVYKKDIVDFKDNTVLFYHHNSAQTIFDVIVAQQAMDSEKEQLYNPLKNLAFGGILTGKDFVANGTSEGVYVNADFKGWKLKTKKPSKKSIACFVFVYSTSAGY